MLGEVGQEEVRATQGSPRPSRKHEWEKHGTCAAQLPILNSQRKYFGTSLALYHQLDLNRWVRTQMGTLRGYTACLTAEMPHIPVKVWAAGTWPLNPVSMCRQRLESCRLCSRHPVACSLSRAPAGLCPLAVLPLGEQERGFHAPAPGPGVSHLPETPWVHTLGVLGVSLFLPCLGMTALLAC